MIRKTKRIKTKGVEKDEKVESQQWSVKQLDLQLLWRTEQSVIWPNNQSFWAFNSCSVYHVQQPDEKREAGLGSSPYTNEEEQEKIWDLESHAHPTSPERQQ